MHWKSPRGCYCVPHPPPRPALDPIRPLRSCRRGRVKPRTRGCEGVLFNVAGGTLRRQRNAMFFRSLHRDALRSRAIDDLRRLKANKYPQTA